MESIELLESYKSLWSNRTLQIGENPDHTLRNAIKKELKDEMTHPRLRKTSHEKFYLSVKRIIDSSLHDKQKVNLVNYHLRILEELKQGGSL